MFEYRTIGAAVQVKHPVGACRFYASLAPVETEEEGRAYLEGVKAQLPGATHHATACRLGWGEGMLARSDDDGEPAGTAGPPLLAVLEKAELTNVMLVATRYFGGVKLGIGGLIRAYRACGEAGVQAGQILHKELKASLELVVPYDYLGAVEREIKAREGAVLKHRFDQDVVLDIVVPLRKLEGFSERMAGLSRGEVIIKRMESGVRIQESEN